MSNTSPLLEFMRLSSKVDSKMSYNMLPAHLKTPYVLGDIQRDFDRFLAEGGNVYDAAYALIMVLRAHENWRTLETSQYLLGQLADLDEIRKYSLLEKIIRCSGKDFILHESLRGFVYDWKLYILLEGDKETSARTLAQSATALHASEEQADSGSTSGLNSFESDNYFSCEEVEQRNSLEKQSARPSLLLYASFFEAPPDTIKALEVISPVSHVRSLATDSSKDDILPLHTISTLHAISTLEAVSPVSHLRSLATDSSKDDILPLHKIGK